MLKSLHIKNYALIRQLDLSPASGLNIVTGETGAGKSIMLGAIGLLLGNRADTKALFNQDEKCIIEGTFNVKEYNLKGFFDSAELDYDDTCIIRREISPQNKSRAFVNDTPVTLEILKKLGVNLMDIHSQHETLLLGSADFQIGILDACAGSKKLLEEYQEVYNKHKKLTAQYDKLWQQNADARKEFDYNNFLFEELDQANLQENEQKSLEEELNLLENAEEIKTRLNEVVFSLDRNEFSVLANLQVAVKNLESVAPFSPSLEKLKERLTESLIEIKDVISEAEREEENVELNTERANEVRERVSLLFDLQQKHSVSTVEDLIQIKNELEEKVQKVGNLDEQLEELNSQLNKVYEQVLQLGKKLSEARNKVKGKIKEDLERLLKEVGMPNATLEVKIQEQEPGSLGIDKVNFLFSANKGIPAQELKNAASGGEFSRLMLCLKYIIADKTALPVIVFDEIDTGISGEIAIKVGKIMKQMSQKHQIISISHLPQIAAHGDAHYFVYKDDKSGRAVSQIKELTAEERVLHIARMIGGETPSETAIQSARELMKV